MKTQVIVKELEEVAKQLGLGVRKEKGNFKGGRCVVGGKEMIVLNRHHVPELHLSILAEALRGMPVDSVFMKPAVRKALEESWESSGEVESDEISGTGISESDTPTESDPSAAEAEKQDETPEQVDAG